MGTCIHRFFQGINSRNRHLWMDQGLGEKNIGRFDATHWLLIITDLVDPYLILTATIGFVHVHATFSTILG